MEVTVSSRVWVRVGIGVFVVLLWCVGAPGIAPGVVGAAPGRQPAGSLEIAGAPLRIQVGNNGSVQVYHQRYSHGATYGSADSGFFIAIGSTVYGPDLRATNSSSAGNNSSRLSLVSHEGPAATHGKERREDRLRRRRPADVGVADTVDRVRGGRDRAAGIHQGSVARLRASPTIRERDGGQGDQDVRAGVEAGGLGVDGDELELGQGDLRPLSRAAEWPPPTRDGRPARRPKAPPGDDRRRAAALRPIAAGAMAGLRTQGPLTWCAMNVLIIGGGVFLGQALLQAGLEGGHGITVFNRGHSRNWWPPGVQWVAGDRKEDVHLLMGRRWDAVIDTCGYRPQDVEATCAALFDSCDRYVFISSVSAYASFAHTPIGESDPRGEFPATLPVTPEMVGATVLELAGIGSQQRAELRVLEGGHVIDELL